MARRWCLCKMIEEPLGDGTTAWAPATNRYNLNSRIVHLGNPNWVLCRFAARAADLPTIDADPDIRILPNYTSATLLSDIPAGVRNAAITVLQNNGFSTAGVNLTWTYGRFLRFIGRQIDPVFDESVGGDVVDTA